MPYTVEDRELDRMIRDMRVGCGLGPCGAHRPEDVTDDPPRFGERDVEGYLAAQKLRHALIEKIEKSPGWRRRWRADRDLNARIEALCEAKGYQFKPWEDPPWWDGAEGKALKLRKQLIAELKASEKPPEPRQRRRLPQNVRSR